MDDNKSILHSALDIAKKGAKGTVNVVVKESNEVLEATSKQVGIKTEPSQATGASDQQSQTKNENNQAVVDHLYGVNKNKEQKSAQANKPKGETQENFEKFKKEHKGKTPEEIQKLYELRQKLHGEYYQRLTQKPKPQEETPKEKVEKEKEQEEKEKLFKEKKKEKGRQEIAVTMAQSKTERHPGVSG